MKNKYYIVNDTDRPDQRHVAQLTEDGLVYLHPGLSDWQTMSMRSESTPVEDFGFRITEDGDHVRFELAGLSAAKYRDGKIRQ